MKSYTKAQIDSLPDKGTIKDLQAIGIRKSLVNYWIQNNGFPADRVGINWIWYKAPLVKWFKKMKRYSG